MPSPDQRLTDMFVSARMHDTSQIARCGSSRCQSSCPEPQDVVVVDSFKLATVIVWVLEFNAYARMDRGPAGGSMSCIVRRERGVGWMVSEALFSAR